VARHQEENIANRILLALPQDSLQRLKPHLERVDLPQRRVVHDASTSVEHLYFVNQGLISLIKTMKDGRTVEVAAIGTEGVTGIFALYGIQPPIWDAIVQIPGEAFRVELGRLQAEMKRSDIFRGIMQRYIHAVVCEIAQTAACNRLHSLEERCCRWLLLAQERAQSDTFPVTHEFLALMLGVQRAGLSITAGILQKAGFIQYSRGRIVILDRSGLEATTCECYLAITAQLKRVFDQRPRRR
jgi:CRP-like cAMP-binding protein